MPNSSSSREGGVALGENAALLKRGERCSIDRYDSIAHRWQTREISGLESKKSIIIMLDAPVAGGGEDRNYYRQYAPIPVMVGGDRLLFSARYYDLMKTMCEFRGCCIPGNWWVTLPNAGQISHCGAGILPRCKSVLPWQPNWRGPDLVYLRQFIRGGLAGRYRADASADEVDRNASKPGFRIDLHNGIWQNALEYFPRRRRNAAHNTVMG